MDKLIAQASESLAKAGMNRRGFLGKLAGAARWRCCAHCRLLPLQRRPTTARAATTA